MSRPSLEQDFTASPLRLHSRPLWFWNGLLTQEKLAAQLEESKAAGYAGLGILPAPGMYPPCMSPAFLDLYRAAADKAAELGLKLCLYDEYWFPSGSAGGRLEGHYPEALCKRLDMISVDVDGPARVRLPIPPGALEKTGLTFDGREVHTKRIPGGRLMGAVAMRMEDHHRIDVTAHVRDGVLEWTAPSPGWKVMLFVCLQDGVGKLVDYLDPEAVQKYIALTYEAYFKAFPDHFGTTIDSAFYDEPTSWNLMGGRGWTPAFNDKYRAMAGESGPDPLLLYPALWFDIGPDTTAARNALFGFRAELYSIGFPKVVSEWCRAHRIELTGHLDQEEIVNPTGLSGDLMKALKHQDIPGVDQIFYYGRASRAYKVVTSAAQNFDKPLVMVEVHGATKEMPVANLYKDAMDMAAKGVNLFVPHGVWYDSGNLIFPPNLAGADPTYGPHLAGYNRYIGRVQRLLQGGRHVADIGVLYPIAALQAGYYFGDGDHYRGGVTPPEADYMEVGEILSLKARRDFTFLHPEVVEAACEIDGATLRMNNAVNWEAFRVVIIPGSAAISVKVLRKLKQFHDAGGQVIGTTLLPTQSAEFGHDREVRDLIAAMFERGKAVFVPRPAGADFAQLLDRLLAVPDVRLESSFQPPVEDGCLSYIHKVLEGREIYFLANSSATALEVGVQLRDHLQLEQWDPHDGKRKPLPLTHALEAGQAVTRATVALDAVRSLFLVSSGL